MPSSMIVKFCTLSALSALAQSVPGCAPRWQRGNPYTRDSLVSSVDVVDRAGTETVVTKNYKCISGSDLEPTLSHCSTYDPSNLLQASVAWTDNGVCDENAPAPASPTSALWSGVGCPKSWTEGASYKAGELAEVDGAVFKCSTILFVNAWCGTRDYKPGAGLFWTNAWTRLGSCDGGTMNPTLSPVFQVLTNHEGCPKTFDSSFSHYEANDKVSVPVTDAVSVVYKCSSDLHESRWCNQFEPGSSYNLGWELVGYCDGTLSPTSSPAFNFLDEISGGCPRPYSSASLYQPGDQVSLWVEGATIDRAVVWECKQYPHSPYCNSGIHFSPGSENSHLGWKRKGYCQGSQR